MTTSACARFLFQEKGISLFIVLAFMYGYFDTAVPNKSYISLMVFSCGLIGGFVSIQQRIHKVSNDELEHLAES